VSNHIEIFYEIFGIIIRLRRHTKNCSDFPSSLMDNIGIQKYKLFILLLQNHKRSSLFLLSWSISQFTIILLIFLFKSDRFWIF